MSEKLMTNNRNLEAEGYALKVRPCSPIPVPCYLNSGGGGEFLADQFVNELDRTFVHSLCFGHKVINYQYKFRLHEASIA